MIYEVRLRDFGPRIYGITEDLFLNKMTLVIIEHDRGIDYGRVVSDALNYSPKEPLRKIIRIANQSDINQIEQNRKKAKEAKIVFLDKVKQYELDMKLVETEYSLDEKKVVFYFTAEGRVDFRQLLKDLAKVFKARIELRQIGVRDEAKLRGGMGSCGRELCCVTFLKDFEPVTIKMAKEEGLSLNPTKISGVCGRLMCCLYYEYETYKILSRGLPKEGERIATPEGRGKVIGVNVFTRKVSVELENGKQIEIGYK
ncbi:MAG: stage 0 sporulation family protein [Candidatus Omnitrophica bacterium]|nr:stage 0 sporulation family protein [Candidatus Omnitrophota bacterium]